MALRLNSKSGRRLILALLAGSAVLCLAATGIIVTRDRVAAEPQLAGEPAAMGDGELGLYIRESLARRHIPVVAVTVTGEGTNARKALIELETESAEAINPMLGQVMLNITGTVATLVDDRGTDLDYYSVLLRDKAGDVLLDLQVDINNMSSHWRRDPRLVPLHAPPPIPEEYRK